MTTKELETELRRLQLVLLLESPSLNCGGCGIFARHFYERVNIPNAQKRILYLGHSKRTLEDKLDSIKANRTRENWAASHVIVAITIKRKTLYVDGHKTYRTLSAAKDEFTCDFHVDVPIDLLKRAVKKKGDWNDSFRRSSSERAVKEIIVKWVTSLNTTTK
jgi:phage tail sheath protein FI